MSPPDLSASMLWEEEDVAELHIEGRTLRGSPDDVRWLMRRYNGLLYDCLEATKSLQALEQQTDDTCRRIKYLLGRNT